jgi:subtilisin-like proprotein convertase family protein
MPIRLRSGLGSMREAEAFHWAADHGADVISCSWGPEDGEWWRASDPQHRSAFPLPASTRLAIDYATTQGRGGKGCVVLFAAGNGRESADLDGYASYSRVIAVAACNDRGKRSVYSDEGNAVWCSFPSSDFGYTPLGQPQPLTPGIWTTDRVGGEGYNPNEGGGDAAGHYTNDFGGTSSACPGAAGVAALALAANPGLTREEVRDILKRSCDPIDPQGGAYVDGKSKIYGHGRLNAATAVALAQDLPPETATVSRSVVVPIQDFATANVTLDVADARPVRALTVRIDIRHSYVGDLVVTLTPPAATGVPSVVLHNRAGGSADNLIRSYNATTTPALAPLHGVPAKGEWTLSVKDEARLDVGTIRGLALELAFEAAERAPRSRARAAAQKSRKKVEA